MTSRPRHMETKPCTTMGVLVLAMVLLFILNLLVFANINCKGFYSLNLLSINDSQMWFIYVNLEIQGATHDSTAFFATECSKHFLDSNTNPPFD
jgi:hypothetical protein